MTDPMQHSDAVPTGSAGLVNQGRGHTVESVGAAYGAQAEAACAAAMGKCEAEWASMSGMANMADEGMHTA